MTIPDEIKKATKEFVKSQFPVTGVRLDVVDIIFDFLEQSGYQLVKWEPIENAPMDGEYLIAGFDEPTPFFDVAIYDDGIFWISDFEGNDRKRVYPTHFAYLPTPPKTESEAMSKYYYTDPLIGAYMAKEFGVKLINEEESDVTAMCDAGLMAFASDNFVHQIAYIHPDSLHILEPQVGDLVEIEDSETPYQIINYDAELFDIRHGIKSILQRNGKPFFWPERESI